jgi:hypothetical protein
MGGMVGNYLNNEGQISLKKVVDDGNLSAFIIRYRLGIELGFA